MGFFKDFKRDFAQAVNELMPDKDELGAEYDDEDMVNTFDENDQMEVAPEDLLENLDEIRIDRPEPEMPEASENLEHFSNVETTEKDKTSDETSVFDTVPEAEVLVMSSFLAYTMKSSNLFRTVTRTGMDGFFLCALQKTR